MLVDNFAESAPGHVRVDLRGGDVGVSQHDLDAAEVRAAFHQMRGKTVPDDVGRQPAENSYTMSMVPEQGPEGLPRHRRTPGGHEQILAGAALEQRGTARGEITIECDPGRFSKRD